MVQDDAVGMSLSNDVFSLCVTVQCMHSCSVVYRSRGRVVTRHMNVQLCGKQQQQLRERCVEGEHSCSVWGCLLTAPSMTTEGLGSSGRFRDSLVSGANGSEQSRVM